MNKNTKNIIKSAQRRQNINFGEDIEKHISSFLKYFKDNDWVFTFSGAFAVQVKRSTEKTIWVTPLGAWYYQVHKGELCPILRRRIKVDPITGRSYFIIDNNIYTLTSTEFANDMQFIDYEMLEDLEMRVRRERR